MRFRIIICVCVLFIVIPMQGVAQTKYDKDYIEDHTRDLTVRAYTSFKFSGYKLGQYGFPYKLSYKSNDNYNIGAGFNYRNLGFNVAAKVPFINDDEKRLGETKFLDLQTYLYMSKWIIDLSAQFYQGFYLSSDDILNTQLPSRTHLLRPDVRTAMLGGSVQKIFNDRRFSYRGVSIQNEYQKKSAGSLIVGGNVNFIRVKADSAVIPENIADNSFFAGSAFDRSHIFCIGMNAGYAQTWVIKSHYFIMGSLMGGVGVNITSLADNKNDIIQTRSGLQLNGAVRVAAGYNSSVYYVGIQFMETAIRNNATAPNSWQEFDNGNLKLVFAKRFRVDRKSIIREVYDKIPPPLL